MRLKVACNREIVWVEFPDGVAVSVARVLVHVKEKRPDVYKRWCDVEGRLPNSLAIFVNREHICYRKGLETNLDDGDELYIIPAVAGG